MYLLIDWQMAEQSNDTADKKCHIRVYMASPTELTWEINQGSLNDYPAFSPEPFQQKWIDQNKVDPNKCIYCNKILNDQRALEDHYLICGSRAQIEKLTEEASKNGERCRDFEKSLLAVIKDQVEETPRLDDDVIEFELHSSNLPDRPLLCYACRVSGDVKYVDSLTHILIGNANYRHPSEIKID
jgi:hypothetical protein